jgi:hypothetical protein
MLGRRALVCRQPWTASQMVTAPNADKSVSYGNLMEMMNALRTAVI